MPAVSPLAVAVRWIGPSNKQSATGTITNGAYADQTALNANQAGVFLLIVNMDSQEPLLLNFGAAAGSAAAPAADAISIAPGDRWLMQSPGPVFSDAVHLAAATAAHAFLIWYA